MQNPKVPILKKTCCLTCKMAEWPIGGKTIHSDRYKPIRCDIDDQYIYDRFKVKHIYNKQGQNSVRHNQTVTPELCDLINLSSL